MKVCRAKKSRFHKDQMRKHPTVDCLCEEPATALEAFEEDYNPESECEEEESNAPRK